MPEGTKLYYVKYPDGTQEGPMDEDNLIILAKKGKITLDCQIRSTLIPVWNKAIELPAIKPLLQQAAIQRLEQQNDTLWNKIRARITLRASGEIAGTGLVKASVKNNPNAELLLRVAAGVTDMLILGVWALALFFAFAWLFAHGHVSPERVWYYGFMIFFVSTVIYFVEGMSRFTQTPGQRCWGVFLVRLSGETHWEGRAFFYTILMLIFGIFTPLFYTVAGTSLQELVTRTRMARITANNMPTD